LNIETIVIDVSGVPDSYMVEGYISLRELQEGDTVRIREYIAVDGVTFDLFSDVELSGPQAEPVIRLHTKTLLKDMRYRVTITQTTGIPRSFPYGFIVEILGVV